MVKVRGTGHRVLPGAGNHVIGLTRQLKQLTGPLTHWVGGGFSLREVDVNHPLSIRRVRGLHRLGEPLPHSKRLRLTRGDLVEVRGIILAPLVLLVHEPGTTLHLDPPGPFQAGVIEVGGGGDGVLTGTGHRVRRLPRHLHHLAGPLPHRVDRGFIPLAVDVNGAWGVLLLAHLIADLLTKTCLLPHTELRRALILGVVLLIVVGHADWLFLFPPLLLLKTGGHFEDWVFLLLVCSFYVFL